MKRRLAAVVGDSPDVRTALEQALVEINGTPGISASFDGLDRLIQMQSYRIAAWRVAGAVQRSDDDAIVIGGAFKDIRIEPAPADLMFRWMVTIGRRKRRAMSLVGVLRQVREALDPAYATNRVRVVLTPLMPY